MSDRSPGFCFACLCFLCSVSAGGGGTYFVGCLSHLTIDHASLSRHSTVPTPKRDTSNIWALILRGDDNSRVFCIPALFSVLIDTEVSKVSTDGESFGMYASKRPSCVTVHRNILLGCIDIALVTLLSESRWLTARSPRCCHPGQVLPPWPGLWVLT